MEEMMSMRAREMEQVFTASFFRAAQAFEVFCAALKQGISAKEAKNGVESVAGMNEAAAGMFSMAAASAFAEVN
jgi:hypothetical protein